MNKYIITILVAAALVVPASVGAQTNSAAGAMPKSKALSYASCIGISSNLTVGSNDLATNGQVTALQNMLYHKGHMSLRATGYFGQATAQAVRAYQKSQGLPATGYVGPMTRAKITLCKMNPGNAENIKIISPIGGEQWKIGSVQKISWTDSNVYIQAPKYDVKIQQDLDCQPNQPCIMLYPIPATIATGVSDTSYLWSTGTVVEGDRTIGAGKYRIFVCPSMTRTTEDLTNCTKSASYITITGTSTTQ